MVYKPVFKPVFKPGNFRSKKPQKGCFPLKETFFPLAAAFFSQYSFYHFGCIFCCHFAFIFVFVKSSGGLCNTKKLLPCVSSEKKVWRCLKAPLWLLGHFLCWSGFIFGSGFFCLNCFFSGGLCFFFKKNAKDVTLH